MGRASKWVRKFLLGKKEKRTHKCSFYDQPSVLEIDHFTTTPITIPPTTPKEKKRWSFRRSSATAPGQRDFISVDAMSRTPALQHASMDLENDSKTQALAVAVATAAAAHAAGAAAKSAAAVFQLTSAAASGKVSDAIEKAAAVKIQSAFRGYLARTALNALRGLVKLQALVRGHLVRKQATATLRCMQALVTAQERARAQRIQMVEEAKINNQKQFSRKSSPDNRFRQSNQDFDRNMEENIKIVEMDMGDYRASTKSRYSYSSYAQTELMEPRFSTRRGFSKQENQQISPIPSDMKDLSPKARSGHFEECSIGTAQSSPQYYYSDISKPDDTSRVAPFTYARSELGDSYYNEYPFHHPNYMANTQSSRAKVRSHSAPKQRPEAFERQPSRRSRPSIEGRNVPRAVKMQRSSSNLGSVPRYDHYPWSIKLDKSGISLKDSDCGSNYTVQSVIPNTSYRRSVVGF